MFVLRFYVPFRMENPFGGHLGHYFDSKELPRGDTLAFSGLNINIHHPCFTKMQIYFVYTALHASADIWGLNQQF